MRTLIAVLLPCDGTPRSGLSLLRAGTLLNRTLGLGLLRPLSFGLLGPLGPLGRTLSSLLRPLRPLRRALGSLLRPMVALRRPYRSLLRLLGTLGTLLFLLALF